MDRHVPFVHVIQILVLPPREPGMYPGKRVSSRPKSNPGASCLAPLRGFRAHYGATVEIVQGWPGAEVEVEYIGVIGMCAKR